MVQRSMLNCLTSSEDSINAELANWTSSYQLGLIFNIEQRKTKRKSKKKKSKKKNKEVILKFHLNHQPQQIRRERKIRRLSSLQNKLNKEKNKKLIAKRRKMVQSLKKLRNQPTKIIKKKKTMIMKKRRFKPQKKWKKDILRLDILRMVLLDQLLFIEPYLDLLKDLLLFYASIQEESGISGSHQDNFS